MFEHALAGAKWNHQEANFRWVSIFGQEEESRQIYQWQWDESSRMGGKSLTTP